MPKPLPSDDLSIIGMFKSDKPEHFYMHFAYDSTESAWGQGPVGIYGTGNPVHLPNPNPYPTCALTDLDFHSKSKYYQKSDSHHF